MIHVCEPVVVKNQKKYVNDCLDTNWISSNGKYIEQFEDKFSKFCDCEYGVSTTNGTTALHLALEALDIGVGDEVIVPEFTMIATANAVLYTGAKPVFVDSNFKTWNMDLKQLHNIITDKTKAIIVVHTYGNPVDMDLVNHIAKEYNLYVIEDAAEAHGALYKDKKIGSLGDIGCFSFYGNKIISCGEGGMVVTNNKKIFERCKLLKNHAFIEPRFFHYQKGFNYRMTNIQAAIGLAQTEQADTLVDLRVNHARYYTKLIKEKKLPIITPPENENGKNVYWMYGILLDRDKEPIMRKLKEKGVDTRSFFFPMSLQPCFTKKNLHKNSSYPEVAMDMYKRGLYLPSGSGLTKEQIEEVVNKLEEVLK